MNVCFRKRDEIGRLTRELMAIVMASAIVDSMFKSETKSESEKERNQDRQSRSQSLWKHDIWLFHRNIDLWTDFLCFIWFTENLFVCRMPFYSNVGSLYSKAPSQYWEDLLRFATSWRWDSSPTNFPGFMPVFIWFTSVSNISANVWRNGDWMVRHAWHNATSCWTSRDRWW
jgi:hypothetical protein